MLLSVLLFFLRSPSNVYIVLLLRAIVLLIIDYPFQEYLPVELALFVGLQLEIVGRAQPPHDGVLACAFLVATIAFLMLPQRFILAGHATGIPKVPIHALTLFGFAFAAITCLTYLLKLAFQRVRKLKELIQQQDANIGVLIRANLAFQEFANLADSLAAQKERERITREIHDSSGYVFTNLIALMEVAISLGAHDLDGLTEIHYQAKRQAQEGLHETRRSLRRLRDSEEDGPKGIKALLKVLRTFEKVTNIKVVPALGNVRWAYGASVDFTIYRIVQEALTNSFRHGNATTIWISFWEQQRTLIINIKDDGKGAEKIEKGIGLTGMEERLSQIGGTLEIPESTEGFHLLIRIPVEELVQ